MLRPDFVEARTQLVVIQPTPFCNINCRYCYLPNRSLAGRMSWQTLSRVFEALFSSSLLADKVTIVWHAGEPMVVPVDFYERAFQLIEQFNTQGVRVVTAFQTNGTLITQEWCDFIKRRQVKISVSLDGPQQMHDRQRVDRSGRGTFERTMRGIELLLNNGIKPSIIMVLTEQALDFADEIWQFFAEHHLSRLAFNIEEINGANTRSSLDVKRDINRYKQFLRRFLELSDASANPPTIREIGAAVDCIRSFERPIFALENTPAAILSFDYRGNVSTFASELLTTAHPRYGDCLLGNVFEGSLEELLARQKLVAMNAEVQSGVARCKASCRYFAFCGGGSPVNKLSENGTFDSTETMQCKLRIQATMDVMLEYFERRYDLQSVL
jgi:uncharacterized protein